MDQLPIFLNLKGAKVVLIGKGDAADAKRRLIERAGGIVVSDCPNAICSCGRIAFIALDDEADALRHAGRLRSKGMLVNLVDRPEHCDFTTPAIIDRDPVLLAISTGGASAGMAKAIRQRLETVLPQSLGGLARAVASARDQIRKRWPDAPSRRRALDAAFASAGPLDPFASHGDDAVDNWLAAGDARIATGLHHVDLLSADPDDLTLRTARLLGEADHIFYDAAVPTEILNRARADAIRHAGPPPEILPAGLSLYLNIPANR
jgi:uroporphyrin-III C-methyltransferase / precorrin-2 dehydrogenase / sirohydrochlorin ferrochelatase